jgi:hypothetical protein
VIELPESCYFRHILFLGDCRSEPLAIRLKILDGISPVIWSVLEQ